MSLIIYTDKSQFDSKDFISDVNSAFKRCSLKNITFCKMVIKEVDRGEYLGKMSFIDRLGYKLYTKFLSTSSKALICLNEFSDMVIDFCEVGDDLGKYILCHHSGKIYIPSGRLQYVLARHSGSVDVIINENKFKDYDYTDLLEYLEEEDI